MARLKCICGEGLSNTNVPSENIVQLFKLSEVEKALAANSGITLFDYETSLNEDFEFWYCSVCKRVYVVENIPNGKIVASYKECSAYEYVASQGFTPVYIFNYVDIYNAEENNPSLLLSEFIKINGEEHLYYLSADRGNVYKATNVDRYLCVYSKE